MPHLANLVVLATYLIGMLVIGIVCSRRNLTTEEYFVGGRNFPAWILGISMLGTSISAITFLSFPADAFQGNWSPLVFNLMLPLVAIVAIALFIPFFRQGNLTSAFEYLDARFGPELRIYGTCSFILLQLIRISMILFLIAIQVQVLTELPQLYVILIVGVFVAVYTVVGGIDAVIWTDVIQSVVLWFGGLLCLGYIAWQLPGGFGEILSTGAAAGKFDVGDFHFKLSEKTFWTLAVLGVLQWLATFTSDQTFIQRFVAAKSLSGARQAATLYCCLAVPTWIFFFFLGSSLFAFYEAFPDPAIASLPADEVFPRFILQNIPQGLAGLVIAGVLAAAMSSIDSSLNSIATLVTVDILKPHAWKNQTDETYLKTAKWISAGAAVCMMLGAQVLSQIPKTSVNNFNLVSTSLCGGCLVGLFLAGFFSLRIDRWAAGAGTVVALLLNVYFLCSLKEGLIPESFRLPVHEMWVGLVVNAAFLVVALAVGIIRNPTTQDRRNALAGLTVWTFQKSLDGQDG